LEIRYGEEIDDQTVRTIDKYIIKKFLGTFFFAIFLLAFVVIIFDISEKIDDFLKHNVPLKAIIVDYYLNFIPYFLNLFSYLFTFIAVIFFTSKMASDTEIVAILSSGISFRRFLFPYFVSASLLALMSFILANFIIPYTNRGMFEFEKKYINTQKVIENMNIHKQISPGTFIYMENFNVQTKAGRKFSLEQFRNKEMVFKLMSETIEWDSATSKWKLNRYYSRRFYGKVESIRKGTRLDTIFALSPKDMNEDIEEVKVMDFFTLREQIKKKEMRGDPDVIKYKVKKYERFAFPFATLILTLIGVSVSSRKVRGGIGFNLGLGLGLTFMYILFMQVFTVLATFGNLPPLLAVWIPNILFGIIALVLARLAPK
jgi:lipopolysaccharide export system permease protein